MNKEQVAVGQYYKHVASGVYVDDDRNVWARPMSEFMTSFEEYGA